MKASLYEATFKVDTSYISSSHGFPHILFKQPPVTSKNFSSICGKGKTQWRNEASTQQTYWLLSIFFFQELQQNLFLKTGLHPSTLQLCFLAQHLELGEVKTSLSTSTYMHHPIMMMVLELLILQRVNLKMSNLLLKINKGSINLC